MEPFVTDQGTLQLLSQLDRGAGRKVAAFLVECDGLRVADPSASLTLHPVDFVGRDDVVEMKLERRIAADRKIVSTVKLANGALWRCGQLRMPGVQLPDTVRNAVRGRLIEEIVAGAPFTGFTVTGAVQDGSGADTTLRLRCTAERTGEIAIDPAASPERGLSEIEAMARGVADVPIDPVSAHILNRLPRRDALLAIVRLAGAKPGTVERLPILYRDLLEGERPAHLVGAEDHPKAGLLPGHVDLKKVKAGYQVYTMANSIRGRPVMTIENGMVDHADDIGTATAHGMLGFDVPGLVFGTREKWVHGGTRSRELLPLRTVGEAMGL